MSGLNNLVSHAAFVYSNTKTQCSKCIIVYNDNSNNVQCFKCIILYNDYSNKCPRCIILYIGYSDNCPVL